MSARQRVARAIRHNLVAWVALFFALAGSGFAASRYILTSTSQIKPSVLRELRGDRAAAAAVPKGPKAIIDRVGLVEPVVTTTQPVEGPFEPPPIPLASATWTQAAHQADMLFGNVTISNPPKGSCREEEGAAIAFVVVILDGHEIGSISARSDSPYKSQSTYQFEWSLPESRRESNTAWLVDPSVAVSHAIKLESGDLCRDGSHFTITSLQIDVLGFR